MSVSVTGQTLKAFFENQIFLASISSWIFAQLLKTIIVILRSKRKTARDVVETFVWRTGGMPSSHAAMVSTMATMVAFLEGIGSNLFIITFFFAMVIIRDAVGVRRSSGLQARSLNLLGKSVAERFNIEYHPTKEVLGHTPLEVVVGVLLGIFIAAAFAKL
ncbi:MAG: divergent PAP2 family protein [Spirochaetaceae bacterium]|jgi:acid phosphatase family membrane protein YuiD|nr:divergent PAP2 family protein [Spirochaetaceae bacterium]